MGHVRRVAFRKRFELEIAEGFHPLYVFTPRLVGRLARGELAVEPVLGPVRVVEARTGESEPAHAAGYVVVRWRDEQGPGTASGRYAADRSFLVRMPAHSDRLAIRQGIDQARWLGREVTDDTARLIAAHLHAGTGSPLHQFMVDGSIRESLYGELEVAARHRPYARTWVEALTRYCLARKDTGPVSSWTRDAVAEAQARAEQWLTQAGVNVSELERTHRHNGQRYLGLLARKHIKTETAARLIDAAFVLGIAAAREGVVPMAAADRLG